MNDHKAFVLGSLATIRIQERGAQVEPTAAQAQRSVKILKIVFIVSFVLLIEVTFRFLHPSSAHPSPAMEMAISMVALSSVALGFLAPKFLTHGVQDVTKKTAQSTPVKRWLTSCILSLALFESCILFALVLRVIGARTWIVELLDAVGLIALLVWNPGTPPSEDSGMNSQG